MKITAISLQVRDKNRVNVSVDGGYLFSLNVAQLVDLGIKVGQEYDEENIASFKGESEFGKVYQRALEYSLVRPRSKKEVGDYLYRKTLSRRDKNGELRDGISRSLANRVLDLLVERKYIDDESFASYWIENRFMKKGISKRRLGVELLKKGIDSAIIANCFAGGERDDRAEIRKVVTKKMPKYKDDQKMTAYLLRQGFDYDDIKSVLSSESN